LVIEIIISTRALDSPLIANVLYFSCSKKKKKKSLPIYIRKIKLHEFCIYNCVYFYMYILKFYGINEYTVCNEKNWPHDK